MNDAVCDDPVDNWFDGSTPCPACDHVCFDHAACREAPNCVCHHPCHFGPER